jgi:DNA-directed RNA polymerase subunit RPC12/RpoP
VNTGLLQSQWLGVGIVGTILFLILRNREEPKLHDRESKRDSSTVVRCLKCGQKLRLPILEDDLYVTCPICGFRFTHESEVVVDSKYWTTG